MNSSIVIALPKIDDAKKIRTILNRHGFSVAAVCSTASTALASMSELDGGILICGYKLTDRYYRDVLEDIPSYFEMLLLASGRVIAEAPTSVLTVEMPMKVSDLVNTVDMMLSQIERRLKKEKKKPKTRSWKEQNYISNAKFLLMERNHLSEEDAYRYIQKCSMDSGTNMVETVFGWKLEKRSEQLGCTDGRRTSESGSHPGGRHSQYPQHGRCCICNYQKKRGSVSDRFSK